MAGARILRRKPFWAGALSILLAAAWLWFGRGLDTGSLRAPGPGAFPLALALAVVLFGAIRLFRATLFSASFEDPRSLPFWRSPTAIAATLVALAAASLALLGPASPYFAGFGAGVIFAWYALVLIVCAVAAALMRGGAAALGAVLLGLLLGTSGLDPVTTEIARFASINSGLWFNFIHGLILALIAFHIGFNALLIAAAVALSPKIEKALRDGVASAEGGVSRLLDQPLALALFAVALAALVAGAWLRRKQARAAAPPADAPASDAVALWAQPSFWAGILALLAGAAGLYFGAHLDIGSMSGQSGFGPGAAPMALSAALVLLGALQLVRVFWPGKSEDEHPRPQAIPPTTIGAIVMLALLVLLLVGAPFAVYALGAPAVEFLLRFGPAELAALMALILALCVTAAWLLPRGSILRALGAVCIGLLLGTLGLDPVTGTIRYVPEPDFQAVHGLVIGFVAYRAGYNPLLIAIGFLYAERLENALRQALLIAKGDLTVFADRGMSLGLLIAAVSAVVVAAGLRWRAARQALSPPPRTR